MPVKVALRKTSFVDYPGRISSVLFFPFCNLRCPWCHNRGLVLGEASTSPDSKRAEDLVDIEEALAHLRKRRSVLGGIVLSGGEPCIWEELPELIREIKKIASPNEGAAFPVKLDTNGTNPTMLEKLFAREETRPDYIALDLKIAPRRYAELTASGKTSGLAEALIQSAALIRESGIAHEYRTLALPGAFITGKDIEELAPLTDDSPWHIRAFRGGNCLDPGWNGMEETEAVAKARSEVLVKTAQQLGKTNCHYF